MIQLARPQRTLNLSSLSAYGTVSKGRAKGESMSEKGVYTPSCAPDQASSHQVSKQKCMVEIYSTQANVMLFRSNFLIDPTLTVCIVKM